MKFHYIKAKFRMYLAETEKAYVTSKQSKKDQTI